MPIAQMRCRERLVRPLLLVCLVGYVLIATYCVAVYLPGSPTLPSSGQIASVGWPRICFVYDGTHADVLTSRTLNDLLRELATASPHADVVVLHAGSGVPLHVPDGVRSVGLPRSGHKYDASPALATSLRVLEWLRGQLPFTHIVFHCTGGAAHYAILARGQALALQGTSITLVHSGSEPLRCGHGRGGLGGAAGGAAAAIPGVATINVSADGLEQEHMQRRAAAHADAFLAPRATLRALRSCEWVPRTALRPRLGALDDGAPDGAMDEDGQGGARVGPLIGPVVGPAEAAASSASSASSAVVGPTGVAASSAAMAAWSRSASSLLRLWSGLAPLTKLTKLAPLTKLTDSAYRSELAHSAPIHGNATRMRALYPRTAAWAREQEQPSGGSLSGGSLSGGSASFDGAGAPLAALDGGIGAPLVSVCIVHHERGTLLKQARAHHGVRRALCMQVLTTAPLPRPAGTLLKQALRSLRMQTLPAALFEGLVVDDGSTGREAIEALDEVSRRLAADCLDDCMR